VLVDGHARLPQQPQQSEQEPSTARHHHPLEQPQERHKTRAGATARPAATWRCNIGHKEASNINATR